MIEIDLLRLITFLFTACVDGLIFLIKVFLALVVIVNFLPKSFFTTENECDREI
jgi:hypothetical protein